MARKANGFVISPHTPHELRVYMSEGHRLTGQPTRQQLHKACTVGARVGHSARGKRIKCPSRVGPSKRWTTAEGWDWYEAQINGEGA